MCLSRSFKRTDIVSCLGAVAAPPESTGVLYGVGGIVTYGVSHMTIMMCL